MTEHLLAWEGDDLPEWTHNVELEEEDEEETTSCNTRKDRHVVIVVCSNKIFV